MAVTISKDSSEKVFGGLPISKHVVMVLHFHKKMDSTTDVL